MGLDTTHNAWHGPYSSFNEWRRWLANKIGINLKDYIGYGDEGTKDLKTIDHELQPLFDHSDCDGSLTPDECKQIAEGIDKVLASVIRDEGPFSNYDRAIQFRDGCLKAYEKKETLEFH